ncbi:MAG: hypothetical protein CML46_20595 [Rhodobacteraceae bacterium]|nr:hypothetical protein [Paracoccaceae bacterium]MBR29312.1 hypothetical protein [Paracoccaceae bacterium]
MKARDPVDALEARYRRPAAVGMGAGGARRSATRHRGGARSPRAAWRRRRGLMLRVGLGGAALILLALDLIPDRYAAETVILLPPPAAEAEAEAKAGGPPASRAMAEAEIRRLLSPALLARVSDGLRLETTEEFAALADPLRLDAALAGATERVADGLGAAARAALGWSPPAPAPEPAEALRGRAAARLVGRVSAAPAAGGAGVALRVEAADPGLAALIANSLADLYARDRLAERIAAEERAARLLAHRLEGLTARLAAAEAAAEARRAALRSASAAELAEGEQRLRAHESALDAYRTRGVGEPLAAARADEGRARREWRAAQDRLEAMRAELADRRAAAEARAREDPDLLARAGEARALGALRDATLSRLQAVAGAGAEALGGEAGPERSDIRLAGPALPPATPERLPAAAALLAALGGGLAAAGMAGLAAEASDRALRSLEDAAAEARIPALAALPRTAVTRFGGAGRSGLAGRGGFEGDGGAAAGLLAQVRARPAGPLAEAVRGLRARLIAPVAAAAGFAETAARAPLVIAVTSPGPREGRSETAALLAESCARIGLRTALVDADIRAPGQAARFGLEGAVDLLETLEGAAPLDEVLWTDTATGLSVLPAEPAPAWRADLLAGPAMAALLAALRRRFDVVVLDTPPLLTAADGFLLAARADRVLLLARDGVTRRESLRAAARMLAEHDIRPAGVALTDALAPEPSPVRARRPTSPRDRFGRFSEGFGD